MKKPIQKNKKENISRLNHVESFYNYSSLGEIDYYSEYDCEANGCEEEGICRCRKIENAHFEKIHFNKVFEEFYKFYRTQFFINGRESAFFPYCLHRILTNFKVYDPTYWEVAVHGGYYGEEIGNVKPINLEKIKSCLDELFVLNEENYIPFVLKLEYGHILPRLDGSKYSVEEVSFDKIISANEGYRKKVEAGIYANNYPNNLPIGVYEKRGDFYYLIDGYHRYVDLVIGKKKNFKVVVAFKSL